MSLELTIGGYVIRMEAGGAISASDWPWPAYGPFVTAARGYADILLHVTVGKTLPTRDHGPLLFDSEQGLWRLYQHLNGYYFESFDTLTLALSCCAVIASDFSTTETWLLENRHGTSRTWQPGQLFNPLIQVCLVSKLGRDGGFLLHASGVATEQGTWVFTGDSGAGKSTLAGWLRDRGGIVLNDERLLIRPQDDGLSIWGTPWAGSLGEGHNRSGKLTRLHCIRHGSGAHRLILLSSAMISRLVLRQCFFPHWDPEALAGMLRGITHLVEQVDIVELSFLNDPNVIDFLMHYPLDRAMASP